MTKRRIILPDDIKNLLTMASELKQMKSVADGHDKRIETLETTRSQAAVIIPTVVPPEPAAAGMPIIVQRPLPKEAAKQRKRPLLPIELPPALHSEVVKIEPIGHSVHGLTESMSRKYMSASKLKQSGKKSPVV